MEAQDFMKWVELTGIIRAKAFVEQIGVSRPIAEGFYRDAKAGLPVDVKRPIALAMRAVANGLKPWGDNI